MINVIVKSEFFIGDKSFGKLKNIERKNPNKNEKGHLYIDDKFECTKEMYDFLTIKNKENKAFVDKIGVIPEVEENTEKTKTRTRKRKSVAQK